MPEVRKNPLFAAVFSFFVWGVGQLYAGLNNFKIGIGIVLFIGWISYIIISLINLSNILIFLLIFIVLSILFAFDAYRDTRQYNFQIKIREMERKKTGNFCPECGEKLEGNPRFCPNCGKKLVQ